MTYDLWAFIAREETIFVTGDNGKIKIKQAINIHSNRWRNTISWRQKKKQFYFLMNFKEIPLCSKRNEINFEYHLVSFSSYYLWLNWFAELSHSSYGCRIIVSSFYNWPLFIFTSICLRTQNITEACTICMNFDKCEQLKMPEWTKRSHDKSSLNSEYNKRI